MAVLLPLAQEGSRSGCRSGSNPLLLPLAQPLAVGGGEGPGLEEADELLPAARGAGSRSGSGSDREDMLPACGDISVALDMSDNDEDDGRAVSSSQQFGGTVQPGGTVHMGGTSAASTVSRPVPIPTSAAAGTPGIRQGSMDIISGSIAVPCGSGSGSRYSQGGHLHGIWPTGAQDGYGPVGGSYSPIGRSFGSTAAPDKSTAWNGDVGGIHPCGGSFSGSSYDAAVHYSGNTLPWQHYSGASPSSSYSDAAAAFGSHLLAVGGGLGGEEPAACAHRSGSISVMGSSPDPLLAFGGLTAGTAATVSAFCSVRGLTPAGDADDAAAILLGLHSDTSQLSAGSGTSLQPLGIMMLQQPGGTVQPGSTAPPGDTAILGSTAPPGGTAVLGSCRDKHPLLKRRPLVSPLAAAGGSAEVVGGARKQYGSWEQYIAQQPYGQDPSGVLHPSPGIHASESSENFMLLLGCEDPALSHTSGSRSFGSGIPASCSSSNLLDLLPDFL